MIRAMASVSAKAAAALGAVGLCLAISAAGVSCRVPEDSPRGSARLKASPASRRGAAKANRRCLECHVDFEEEPLVVRHQAGGVTCMRCHGHSQPHIEDEIRATKADVAFRGKAMALFCQTCHEPGKHRRTPSHAAELAKPADKRRSCTACHGEHKLLEIEPAKGRK